MLDFESARQRFVEMATICGQESLPLPQALGRVLAEPLYAQRAVPEFDTSAMDGYALHLEDTLQLPYRLRVEGEAPAGAAPTRLQRGTAMRIFTGAAVPEGADAVVMQEHVVHEGQTIRGDRRVVLGQNVRQRGEDLSELAMALDRGQRLYPATLALVSFLDRAELLVAKAPRVTLLCTGSELRAPGTEARPGTIAESNSPVISALAQQAGACVLRTSLVDDDEVRIRKAIERALDDTDVLVTIGGVSVGDYDFVRPALEAAGVALELYKVGIKPGKPITLGRRDAKVVIGLPGNPASAVVTFALFGMPLLRAMQGDKQPVARPIWIPVATAVKRDTTRTRVVLGSLANFEGRSGFAAHPNQSSGATIALGQTEGFVILQPSNERAEVGTLLPFHRWTDL
jgi:molybdopterin molybdotransferase